MALLAFYGGLVMGGFLGVVVMALLFAGSLEAPPPRPDDAQEEFPEPERW